MKYALALILFLFLKTEARSQVLNPDFTPDSTVNGNEVKVDPKARILYGTASYYADKFHGRKTASGELYDENKLTAACNALPMGTWLKVTNVANNRFVIVRTNDRLHPKMTRIVDLSHAAADKLGYIGKGLAHVRVEVLLKK